MRARKVFARLVPVAAIVPLVAAGSLAGPIAPASAQSGSTTTSPSGGSTATTQAQLSPAQAKALSTNVTHRVIVVLKNQVPQDPASARSIGARKSVEAGLQAPILSELGTTKAKNVHAYAALNAVSATVSPGEQSRLAANPAVAEVVPDQIIHLSSGFDAASSAAASGSRTPLPGACSTSASNPELEPQALSDIHADSSDPTAKTARSLGINGAGVKVAFIADGLDTNNTDFIRPDGSKVFVDYKDFSGEGTAVPTGGGEAFLDASSVAAQGNNVYNISNYSAEPLNKPCYIKVEGVAPGASLVGLDIFGAEDAGFNSSFLQAIDYSVSVDHVNVLNESLGNNNFPDDQASLDLIKQANDQAVAAGVTVTVSSGDAGITNTIGTPATDPHVISAGASTTYQIDSQIAYGGFQFPGVKGYLNDNISSFSSSGFAQDGSTLSLVAPGELNWALCSTDTAEYSECTDFNGNPSPVQESGGTSESAPLTAGVAALVIQAYEKTHGGSAPTPALVKQLITSTADDISAPADLQGSGLIDAYRAVLAAEAYKAPATATAPAATAPGNGTPATLVEGTPQFNAVAAGGTGEAFKESFTNVGSTPAHVQLSTRTLGAYKTVKTATVSLSDTTSPHSEDYQGVNDNYEVVDFSVPPGENRLNGAIAYQAASSTDLSARVRLALVDPYGRLGDYSVPQGLGNYGDTQVANPTPGTWTAYIWSRDSADGGTTGPVVFGASVARDQSFGTASPSSLTIAPGATASATLRVAVPSTPGDTAGALVAAVGGQAPLAVPVTLRTLIPQRPVSFNGTLTGGNGRAPFTGEAEYYQLDVGPGAPALNATITLGDNPANQTYGWLIDPSGQAQAFQSNGLVTADRSGNLSYTNTLGTNLHVLDPAPGRWTLIINFAPTVSGTAIFEPYRVSVSDEGALFSTRGVPEGGSVSAAKPATATVTVFNRGSQPEAYFIDGRSDATAQYNLPSLTDATTTVPLAVTGNVPYYLVPSETTSVTGTASTTGPTPIQFDLEAPSGDPDVASGQGTSVTAGVNGAPLTAGVWDLAPDVVGPFGATGAAPETVNTGLTATTKAFDTGVTSDTGDLWQAAIGGPITVTPVVVDPGHSATITVQLAPTAPAGSRESGVLYLDDDSLYSLYGGLSPNANTIAAIPYSYRVSGPAGGR